jgi:hypothetical protein
MKLLNFAYQISLPSSKKLIGLVFLCHHDDNKAFIAEEWLMKVLECVKMRRHLRAKLTHCFEYFKLY